MTSKLPPFNVVIECFSNDEDSIEKIEKWNFAKLKIQLFLLSNVRIVQINLLKFQK